MLNFFDTSRFMPHGHCYLWDPTILWLHIISDAVITFSYYSIPIMLIYFIFKKRRIPFNWLFLMFALFIFACGTTHLMEIINVWKAEYPLAGVIKMFTAIVSLMTAVSLIKILPKILDSEEKGNLLQTFIEPDDGIDFQPEAFKKEPPSPNIQPEK